MDHTQTDSIIKGSRGVWLLAWPSILTNLLYATGSIVAIKVVGNFGPNEVAAAITGQRITFVIQAILSGILAGTTALVARNWGAKKFDEAKNLKVPQMGWNKVMFTETKFQKFNSYYEINVLL